jgi:hypothetical protein
MISKPLPLSFQELRRLAFAKQQEVIILFEKARQARAEYWELRRAADTAEFDENLAMQLKAATAK